MGVESEQGQNIREARRRASAGERLVPLGPLRERTAVGDGARGLQRRRGSLDVLPPRPRPLEGLPLGRGRPGRFFRRRATLLPRVGTLERP